jgi:hypothetical protein
MTGQNPGVILSLADDVQQLADKLDELIQALRR